jgi:hypothetical protein
LELVVAIMHAVAMMPWARVRARLTPTRTRM